MRRWLIAALVVAACTPAPSPPTDGSGPAPGGTAAGGVEAPALSGPLVTFTTAGGAGGNRHVTGRGDVASGPVEVSLSGRPVWLLAAAVDDTPMWVVVLDDGTVQAFQRSGDAFEQVELNLKSLPPGAPPAAVAGEGRLLLLAPPPPTASTRTNPVALPDSGLAFVDRNGAVVVTSPSGNRSFDVAALPDARLVVSSDGLVAVLTGPTDRYPHGVLGDAVEADAVTVLSPMTRSEVFSVSVAPDVIEGVAPMWADVDEDGVEELIVTVSNARVGARLVVVGENGSVVASSEPIGRGSRWRNQLAVAPLGPEGGIEVVDVVTPHLGGVVTFYRLGGDRLEVVASIRGYTSHVIGSPNLDLALVADADGDGRPEVVIPTQDRRSMAGLQRTADGVAEAWRVSLPARAVTNVAAVDVGGRLEWGVATEDGRLLIWE